MSDLAKWLVFWVLMPIAGGSPLLAANAFATSVSSSPGTTLSIEPNISDAFPNLDKLKPGGFGHKFLKKIAENRLKKWHAKADTSPEKRKRIAQGFWLFLLGCGTAFTTAILASLWASVALVLLIFIAGYALTTHVFTLAYAKWFPRMPRPWRVLLAIFTPVIVLLLIVALAGL